LCGESLFTPILLRRLASFLVSPRHYAETHFLGGSTTFFASVLTSDQLKWNPVTGANEISRRLDYLPSVPFSFY
jgi:hypothetical protein